MKFLDFSVNLSTEFAPGFHPILRVKKERQRHFEDEGYVQVQHPTTATNPTTGVTRKPVMTKWSGR